MSVQDQSQARYASFLRLAVGLGVAGDWAQIAACVSLAFGDDELAVRIWLARSDELFEDVARHPSVAPMPPRSSRELRRSAMSEDPVCTDDGHVLVGLRTIGQAIGVLELAGGRDVDLQLAAHGARLVALRGTALLATDGRGPSSLSATAEDAETSSIMASFAAQAKLVLDHDRLSTYLVTMDGRAVERFAVNTSPPVPGEGVIVPFSEFGLRHVLVNDRPVVSGDLGSDSRIAGREDRIVARAGFHGLLSVPLRLGGKPFGVLNFVSRTPGFYSDEDIPLAQQIADQAAVLFDLLCRRRNTVAWTSHTATESERARLARELHDTLSSSMRKIASDARHLAAATEELDTDLGIRAAELANEMDLVLTDTNRALLDLMPLALDTQSLEAVVEHELDKLQQRSGIKTRFSLKGDTSSLPLAVLEAIYRILQEALRNARLHGAASRVDVGLSIGTDLVLTIDDDGRGFTPEEVSNGSGLGLRFMNDRARSLGGVLTTRSQIGEGTSVQLELLDVQQVTMMPDGAPPPLDLQPLTGVSLRVFIIEPRPLILAGVIHALMRHQDVRVVGSCGDFSKYHARIARLRPDLVLLDIDNDPGAAERVLYETGLASPTTAVVAMTELHGDAVGRLVALGARGVVSKRLSCQGFVDRVKRIMEGDTETADANGSVRINGVPQLTARERQILRFIASGGTNANIAESLFLARKTIEHNVTTIITKLGARNRAHAAALAVATGLVRSEHLGEDER